MDITDTRAVQPLLQIPTMIHLAGIHQSYLSLSQYTPIDSPNARKLGSIGTLVKFKGEPNTYFYFSLRINAPLSNPKFLSVIVTVDGEYRPIYTGGLDDVPGYGRGFIWQPPIRAGATVVIVAGDMRGNATGGALAMKVGAGMAFTTTSNSYWTGQCPPPNGIGITYPAVGNKWVEPTSLVFHTINNTCLSHSNTGSFFNAGTAIGAALGVVSVLVAVAVVLFIRRRRRQRQDIAPIITSPMVTEKNRDARDVQGQELPWGLDRQPAFYLPKPMSSPNPMKQAQLEPRAGLLLHYHPEPFQDTRTMVLDGSSTGQDEVMTQPSIPSDIYTGMGMRPDRPWSGNWQR